MRNTFSWEFYFISSLVHVTTELLFLGRIEAKQLVYSFPHWIRLCWLVLLLTLWWLSWQGTTQFLLPILFTRSVELIGIVKCQLWQISSACHLHAYTFIYKLTGSWLHRILISEFFSYYCNFSLHAVCAVNTSMSAYLQFYWLF